MSTIFNSSKLGGIVTSYENVNFSTSKQKFTFGKGNRFPSTQKVMNEQIQYELPPSMSKRAPSFGFGNRFDRIK